MVTGQNENEQSKSQWLLIHRMSATAEYHFSQVFLSSLSDHFVTALIFQSISTAMEHAFNCNLTIPLQCSEHQLYVYMSSIWLSVFEPSTVSASNLVNTIYRANMLDNLAIHVIKDCLQHAYHVLHLTFVLVLCFTPCPLSALVAHEDYPLVKWHKQYFHCKNPTSLVVGQYQSLWQIRSFLMLTFFVHLHLHPFLLA